MSVPLGKGLTFPHPSDSYTHCRQRGNNGEVTAREKTGSMDKLEQNLKCFCECGAGTGAMVTGRGRGGVLFLKLDFEHYHLHSRKHSNILIIWNSPIFRNSFLS